MTEQTVRKNQILKAAEQLFSKRGYHATTVREIAAALDLEGGSLYGHISGKYELLYTLVLEASEQFRTAAREVLASGEPPEQQLHELMRRHVAIVAQSPERAVVYHHEWKHLNEEHLALLKHQRNEYEQAFRQIIREGVADEVFVVEDERLASISVLSLLNWTYQWYQPGGPLDADGLADYFYRQIMQGFKRPG
jgi:AcrR family transcriptional regulator